MKTKLTKNKTRKWFVSMKGALQRNHSGSLTISMGMGLLEKAVMQEAKDVKCSNVTIYFIHFGNCEKLVIQ